MKKLKWLWLSLIIIVLLILNFLVPLNPRSIILSLDNILPYNLEEMRQKIAPLNDPELHIGLAQEILKFRGSRGENFIEESVKEYQKAIKLDPKSRLAHAGEIIACQYKFLLRDYTAKEEKIMSQMLSAVDEGIKAEPQNALYNYMRGWVYIQKGIQQHYNKELRDDEFIIKDRELVEKGLSEIVIGNQKDYCKDYYSERGKAILNFREKMGMKSNFLDKINIASPTSISYLRSFRTSAEGLKALSRQYENENNQESAQAILKAISQMGRKLMQGSQDLISLMTGHSIKEEQGEEAIRDYYVRREMWKEAYHQEEIIRKRDDIVAECQQKSYKGNLGPLDSRFSSIGADINPEPGLRVFYGLMEEHLLIAFFMLLIIFCISVFVVSLDYKRRTKGHQLSPMKVSLQIKDIAIVYSGLIIPLLFYFINPFYNIDAILVQLLMTTLISINIFLVLVMYRYRLIRQTILPSSGSPQVSLKLKLGMLLLWFVSFILSIIYTPSRTGNNDIVMLWFIGLLICYVYLAYLRTREGALKTSISRYFTAGRINIYMLAAFLGIELILYNPVAANISKGNYYDAAIGHGFIILMFGYLINYFSWLTAIRQVEPEGDLALVYQYRMLEAKSSIPLYAGAAIILLLFNLTVVNPYLQRNAKIYEATVIDKFINDEVGMSSYRALRELKD